MTFRRPHSSVSRARARARLRRGAAFIEALIVISLLTLSFVGLVFFREVYVKQLRVTRLARASVMTYAMTGCTNDNQPRQWIGTRDLGTLDALTPNQTGETAVPKTSQGTPITGTGEGAQVLGKVGAGDGSSILNSITMGEVTGDSSTQTRQGLLGRTFRFQARSRSQSFVSCTEEPRNGGFDDVVDYIMGIFDTSDPNPPAQNPPQNPPP